LFEADNAQSSLEFAMTDTTMTQSIGSADSPKPKLDQPTTPLTLILFFGILGAGVLFVAYSLYVDVEETGPKVTTYLPSSCCS
jgi:inorganic phosphate transporter, PiT family